MKDIRQRITRKRYAEAFFSLIEQDGLEQCFQDFEAFAEIYFDQEELRKILIHPTIHIDRKISILRSIFGPQARCRVVDFLCLLVKRKIMHLFEGIVNEVERLYRRKKGIKGVVVRSAVPLETAEQERLHSVLTKKFGRVEIREVVDKSIIGGLVIQFGDQVVDESLRARRKLLQETLTRVDAEWTLALLTQPTIAL